MSEQEYVKFVPLVPNQGTLIFWCCTVVGNTENQNKAIVVLCYDLIKHVWYAISPVSTF